MIGQQTRLLNSKWAKIALDSESHMTRYDTSGVVSMCPLTRYTRYDTGNRFWAGTTNSERKVS